MGIKNKGTGVDILAIKSTFIVIQKVIKFYPVSK